MTNSATVSIDQRMTAGDWALLRLPDALFPLYYLLRPIRLYVGPSHPDPSPAAPPAAWAPVCPVVRSVWETVREAPLMTREMGLPLWLAVPTAADSRLVAAQEGGKQIDREGEQDSGIVLCRHFT